MDIRSGTTVRASDGRAFGAVKAVVVNPANNEMLALVVIRQDDGSVVVPIDMIGEASPAIVELNVPIKDLQSLPTSAEHYYGHVPSGWEPAPGFGPSGVVDESLPDHGPNETDKSNIRVDGQANVVCEDGPVGTVRRLLVDDYTGEIIGVVISKGQYLDHDVELPFGWVQSMDDGVLHLSCTRNVVKDYPEASPDPY